MTQNGSNLRKAAILVRSLDVDTAASLLGQLSPAEESAIREAVRALGPIDDDERADVLAEFRRVSPLAAEPAARGVELTLSSPADRRESAAAEGSPHNTNGKRFHFLENASTEMLAPYLAREHAQTIAVVLSHLAPPRAAAVLAALPEKAQTDAIERLATLGETDPETVTVLERELAAWLANRIGRRHDGSRRKDAMAAILAAADAATRARLLANLKVHKSALADQIAPVLRRANQQPIGSSKFVPRQTARATGPEPAVREPAPQPVPRRPAADIRPPALPAFDFDDLIHLDDRMLAAVLRAADPNLLTLALAGSSDELVDRICAQLPKRAAREYRREVRRLEPTRLSDVEAAQQAVATLAAQQLVQRQRRLVA